VYPSHLGWHNAECFCLEQASRIGVAIFSRTAAGLYAGSRSLGEAADFLGMAATDTTRAGKGRIYPGADFVHAGARQQPGPRWFGGRSSRTRPRAR